MHIQHQSILLFPEISFRNANPITLQIILIIVVYNFFIEMSILI